MKRRVVITGIGLVTPFGSDVDTFIKSCHAGENPAVAIPEEWHRYADYTSTIWAPLPEVPYQIDEMTRIEQKQLDPVSKNSIHAAFRAIEAAGIKPTLVDEKYHTYVIDAAPPHRTGVFMGTGIGGVNTIADSYAHQILSPLSESLPANVQSNVTFPKRFNAFTVPMLMPNAAAANVAIKLGVTGPNLTFSIACASGTAAIGHCFRAIERGDIDVGLAGGSEYLFDAYGTIFRGFDAVKTLAHGFAPITKAHRPFDQERSGFLFSQGGAAVLVLETAKNAAARGAKPIAQIIGYGESCDAKSIMMIERTGKEIQRMLRDTFAAANVNPQDVDYINAHGTGTVLNDEVEASVISKMYNRRALINSTKALVGHTIGASGAIEAAVTALSLRDGWVHGMPHLQRPIAELNFAASTTLQNINIGVSHSFAFGGHNTALVLRRVS